MTNKTILMAALALSAPALQAGELDELKSLLAQQQAVMAQLQQRVTQLEAQLAAPPQAAARPPQDVAKAPSVALAAGDLPGSFRVPGTETSFKIYGAARIDATYDLRGRIVDTFNNDWASAVFAQPFDDSATGRRHGQFFSTARASRLGFMASTPLKAGNLLVKVEGDFNAPNQYQAELGSNSTLFRLRHAYGQLGNILAGQTWSNFTDLRSFPETVDFNPPGSATLLRQSQLRYTFPAGASSLALSLENPESLTWLPPAYDRANNSAWPGDYDRTPDLTANWTWNGEHAHLSLRAATLEYRNGNAHRRGHALGLSGSTKLGDDTLVASLQGGEGIGRYLFNSVLQGATASGNDLRLWKAAGWHLGLTHPWNAALRSNFIVSQTRFGRDPVADAALRAAWLGVIDDFVPNRRVDQAFLNTFWGIDKNIELGLEYAWGKRRTFGSESATQERINATVNVNFY